MQNFLPHNFYFIQCLKILPCSRVVSSFYGLIKVLTFCEQAGMPAACLHNCSTPAQLQHACTTAARLHNCSTPAQLQHACTTAARTQACGKRAKLQHAQRSAARSQNCSTSTASEHGCSKNVCTTHTRASAGCVPCTHST